MTTSGPINGVEKAGVFSSFASSGPNPGDYVEESLLLSTDGDFILTTDDLFIEV